MANRSNHLLPTSSSASRLDDRSKGTKWSEDEALADAERMPPWHFDESSSDESSSSDDDKDEPPAKKKRVVQLQED